MKVTLKSKGIDLEVDNVEKLQDVLDFVEKFKELELRTEIAKLKADIQAAKSVQGGRKKRTK